MAAKKGVPLWLTVLVIVVGAAALSFPLSLGDSILQSGIASSGGAVGSFFSGNKIAGQQYVAPVFSGKAVCSDSDAGVNLVVKGTCKEGKNGSKTDYCWDQVSVVEFQCSAGKCIQNIFNCQNYGFTSCRDGACINDTHLECIANSCTVVNGAGTDQCSPAGSSCGNKSQPDLTITSLTVSIANGTGNKTNVTLTAMVKNIGNTLAGSSTVRFSVTPSGGSQDKFTPQLQPGEQVTIQTTYFLSKGTYNATATADIFNVVVESDESNNARSIGFTV